MNSTTRERAASAPHAYGSKGIASTTTGTAYCPRARRQTQCERLLAHLLARGSISTFEARDRLRIASPAARVQELEERGYVILSRRDKHQGCARYHLLGEPPEASHAESG